ncbi:MAG: RnfABCDGE type electron transport complex subunit G [Candidatus Cloacimonadaceae bacterium]
MLKDILRLGLILCVICAIATGILAWVNSITFPTITKLKAEDAIKTRQYLMPSAVKFEEKKAAADTSFTYYIAKDDKDETIGYSFEAVKHGYSSDVHTMVALDKAFNIVNMKVISQSETPGLGTHSQDPDFPQRFIGKDVSQLRVDKDGGPIKSITGATITTRAITNSLREAIQLLQADLATQTKAGVK